MKKIQHECRYPHPYSVFVSDIAYKIIISINTLKHVEMAII